ncbi:MAG TPA: hypothetical protein VEK15_06265 [Vicinamibacteria bacterium]|nr:hypothetical protein [Vicinamibacteria bacterium]
MSAFEELVRALSQSGVRFIVIGVWGANYYATSGETLFTTDDRDLFLPADARNLLTAWQACESVGLQLWSGNEPMDKPLDDFLAERASSSDGLSPGPRMMEDSKSISLWKWRDSSSTTFGENAVCSDWSVSTFL